MSDQDATAALFYDHASSVKEAAAPPVEIAPAGETAATAEQRAADLLFGDEPEPAALPVPESIAKLRQSDSKMHDSRESYNGAIEVDDLADFDEAPEVKAGVLGEFKSIANDIGLAPVELREVVTLAKGIRAEPPDAATEEAWQQTACKRVLDLASGDAAAAAADLEAARQLVQRDPRVAQILEATRLGSHPRVVELLVEHARRQRMGGRLP